MTGSDWRTLRVHREIEARPSRLSEQRFADEARERNASVAAEQEARKQAEQTERDAELERVALVALRAPERVRDLLRGDRRETARKIDHHARRLRTGLDELRRRDA